MMMYVNLMSIFQTMQITLHDILLCAYAVDLDLRLSIFSRVKFDGRSQITLWQKYLSETNRK